MQLEKVVGKQLLDISDRLLLIKAIAFYLTKKLEVQQRQTSKYSSKPLN